MKAIPSQLADLECILVTSLAKINVLVLQTPVALITDCS